MEVYCAWCTKYIRTEGNPIEKHLISHGICDYCRKLHWPETIGAETDDPVDTTGSFESMEGFAEVPSVKKEDWTI